MFLKIEHTLIFPVKFSIAWFKTLLFWSSMVSLLTGKRKMVTAARCVFTGYMQRACNSDKAQGNLESL